MVSAIGRGGARGRVLEPGAVFILEYANKRNLKAILRYWLGKQKWSPFTLEPVEFVALNFDFHPRAIRQWLADLGFKVRKTLTVSHFRMRALKRLLPARILAALDGLFQPTGSLFQLTPSVFLRADLEPAANARPAAPKTDEVVSFFQCPNCGAHPLLDKDTFLLCPECGKKWGLSEGIYDFRDAIE